MRVRTNLFFSNFALKMSANYEDKENGLSTKNYKYLKGVETESKYDTSSC